MMNRVLLKFAVVVAGLVATVGCGESDAESPELSMDVDSEVTYTAGEDQVRINLTATDPQNQSLEFELVEGPGAASFYTQQNMAIFKWAPNAGDITDQEPHRVVFAVTNESGRRTERTVHIHIEGRGGTHFLSSANQLYDPSSGEPLVFEVEVQHDEAADVELTMPPSKAPEGAEFEQTGDYVGRFQWLPTPGQREERNHTVVFRADDGEEVVEQKATIIIQSLDSGGVPSDGGSTEGPVCSEELPIAHNPIDAATGAEDYPVTGQVLDDSRDWSEGVVHWTYDDPLGDQEPEYHSAPLEMDGTAFSGTIENPLVEPGEAVDVSYTICVFDGTGEQEGVLCAPREYYYRFVAYPPADDPEVCRGDGVDMSEPASAGMLSASRWDPHRTCEESPNYHRFEVGSGESVEAAVSYSASAGGEPDVEMTLDGEPVEVRHFPCIGLSYGVVDQPGTLQMRVAGDQFPYHATAFVDGADGDQCVADRDSPGDAMVVDEEFVLLEDQKLCSADDIDVYAIDAMVGDFIDALLDFDPAAGDLALTLYSPDQQDEVGQGTTGVAEATPGDDGQAYLGHDATRSGRYYLTVRAGDEAADYELGVGRLCSSDDAFEGNNTLADAEPLEPGTVEDLRLCGGDADWYGYLNENSTSEWVEIRAHRREGGDAGLEMTVYDEAGDPIEGADDQGEDSADTRESIVEVDPDELIVFEVGADSPVVYDLEIESNAS